MSPFQTDGVYQWFSGQSHTNNIYDIHKINYSSQIELIFFLIYIILLFIIFLIVLSGCIHAFSNQFCKCCKREDNFRYSYIFIFTIYSWEYICDILFISFIFINHYNNNLTITDINNQYTILLIITLCCLSFTYIINLSLCCRMIFVLYKHNKRIHDWFHSYCHSFSFIFISFITFGPFISVPFFNSNLFGFAFNSMQISKYDINYILGKKFFNILTQLLPLFLIRIIYIFWIKTWDILILSSFIPIMFSFLISSYYLCHGRSSKWFNNRYLSKSELQCFFEVSGPNLSSKRHLGLTKHLQNKFCKLFKINQNQIQIFTPIHCFDNVSPRFRMRFIVRSDLDTLERIEHEFCSYVQNEQLARAVSQIYGVGLVYISKQLAEIVESAHLLWGLNSKKGDLDAYDNIGHNNNGSYFDIDGNKTVNVYDNGEIRNINIDGHVAINNKKNKNKQNGYMQMNSRSSSSFNHPPIHDVYNHDMPEIMEEDIHISDDEKQKLFISDDEDINYNNNNKYHKVADASSLCQPNQFVNNNINKSEIKTFIQMDKFDSINEEQGKTPGSNEHILCPNIQKQVDENMEQFDSNGRRLSSQEMRLKSWENYCAQTKKNQHKHVKTPSFSISAMHTSKTNISDNASDNASVQQISDDRHNSFVYGESHTASVSNFNNNTLISVSAISTTSMDEEIPQLKFAPPTLEEKEEDNDDDNQIQLKLDTTAPITHQTKSVMVDPIDVQHALSLQSSAIISTNSVSVQNEYVNGSINNENPHHLSRLSQKYEEKVEHTPPPPPPPPPTNPLQPPTSIDSAYGDYVHERDHSESIQDDEIAIEVDYDQILSKPRTNRRSSKQVRGKSLMQHERIFSNEQDLDDNDENEELEGENDSDSFDTHTGTEQSDTEQDSTTKTSDDSSDTVIVHKQQHIGPKYQYNKVITINTKKLK